MTLWTELGICLFGVGLGAVVTRIFFESQIRELKNVIRSLDQGHERHEDLDEKHGLKPHEV